MSDDSRKLERDELGNLRVCYECRNVFLPEMEGDRGWDCPFCKEAGCRHYNIGPNGCPDCSWRPSKTEAGRDD